MPLDAVHDLSRWPFSPWIATILFMVSHTRPMLTTTIHTQVAGIPPCIAASDQCPLFELHFLTVNH